MEHLIYILLFLSALLSGLAVFLFKTKNENSIKLLLAFSGAYLFAICLLHLIPDTYSQGNASIGIYILIGFFLQILLEFFSGGIEHGHIHIHKESKLVFPSTLLVSLCIHAFVEGMPLGNTINYQGNNPLLIGIILHKIPIAFVLMSMLLQLNAKKQTAIVFLILFALMAPLGVLTSNLIGDMEQYFDKIMAIVIGIFLHISTTILFESSEYHRFNLYKFIIIIFGAGLAVLNS
ncbi:MAG TPA: zinc/iron permease [bacterium]|nr:zinc/iron permease [bacterium]